MSLVKDAQHLVKTVVNLAVQTRNLHDDAVVSQTLDKRIGKAVYHPVVVVIVAVVIDIEYGNFDISHLVPQQIDGNHW